MSEISARYSMENLPISRKTKVNVNIDQLGAIGRMLSIQDEYAEGRLDKLAKDLAQVITEQNALIMKFIEEQTKINIGFEARLTGHDKSLKLYFKRLKAVEKKTSELERQLKELMNKT